MLALKNLINLNLFHSNLTASISSTEEPKAPGTKPEATPVPTVTTGLSPPETPQNVPQAEQYAASDHDRQSKQLNEAMSGLSVATPSKDQCAQPQIRHEAPQEQRTVLEQKQSLPPQRQPQSPQAQPPPPPGQTRKNQRTQPKVVVGSSMTDGKIYNFNFLLIIK